MRGKSTRGPSSRRLSEARREANARVVPRRCRFSARNPTGCRNTSLADCITRVAAYSDCELAPGVLGVEGPEEGTFAGSLSEASARGIATVDGIAFAAEAIGRSEELVASPRVASESWPPTSKRRSASGAARPIPRRVLATRGVTIARAAGKNLRDSAVTDRHNCSKWSSAGVRRGGPRARLRLRLGRGPGACRGNGTSTISLASGVASPGRSLDENSVPPKRKNRTNTYGSVG